MIPEYTLKLGLKVYHTNVRAQKINNSIFETFEIVLANFQVKDKQNRTQYLQNMFLLNNINMEMILKMTFFTFNNANI